MSLYRKMLSATLVIAAAVFAANAAQAEVTCEKTDQGVKILIDGELFTEYLTGVAHSGEENENPICYPIIGPTGKKMTRDYPMKDGPESERQDHPHHRSLWFNHGDVNKHSFWHNQPIKHQEFSKIYSDGEKAVVVAKNAWVSNETGESLCEDERTLTFGEMECGSRYIDFDITITAAQDDIVFGDTKEGCMGVRVPGTMKVDAKKVNEEWGGQIVNAQGETDAAAWGERSEWVDYHGPVEGETLGIAMMNHPTSFRFPTWWHVRTYGLFAANPFGLSYFEGKDQDGTVELGKGESITLRYRIVFHEGDVDAAGIAEMYEAYAKSKK